MSAEKEGTSFRDWKLAEAQAHSRTWTPFSKSSTTSTIGTSLTSSASLRSSKLRKRTSDFFSRSRSNAKQPPPVTSEAATDHAVRIRPTTAHSSQNPNRSKTEPLLGLRSSILSGSGRTGQPPEASRSQPNVSLARHDSVSKEPWGGGGDNFKTEDEYYRHRRKQSISPPFNFEHITHTAKAHLPALETVKEQDLPREFWTASRQRPRRHLNGIKADDLPPSHQRIPSEVERPATAKSRPVSPLTPSELGEDAPHIVTPVEPIDGLEESIFDAVMGRTNSCSLKRAPSQRIRHPRRKSSLHAMRTCRELDERSTMLPTLSTFYRSDSSATSSDKVDNGALNAGLTTSQHCPSISPPPQPEGLEFRSKQPLPPIPSVDSATTAFQPIPMEELARVPSIALQIAGEHTWSPVSKAPSRGSSRSSRPIGKSPSQSSSNARQSTIVSDTTWEDDVDFIYEQEAISTCDFNWGTTGEHLQASSESISSDGSPVYHAHSATFTLASDGDSLRNSSKEAVMKRENSHKHRGHVVGHRAFLAARKSSPDLKTEKQTPLPLQLNTSSSYGNLLLAGSSINSGDERKQNLPLTPGTPFFAHAVGPINTESLSDPESCRTSGSTRHRQSSSYGSHESYLRLPRSANPQREETRWSFASTSSIPDLLHSRPRSKLILSKTMVSAPLESLPQSPPGNSGIFGAEGSNMLSRDPGVDPVRNSFVFRESQMPHHRTALDAGERAVQGQGTRVSPQRRASRQPMSYLEDAVEADEQPQWV